jgi:hypothetical protein
MRVAVVSGPEWTAGAPTKVLEARYMVGPGGPSGRNYDITADGERFLMMKAAAGDASSAAAADHRRPALRRGAETPSCNPAICSAGLSTVRLSRSVNARMLRSFCWVVSSLALEAIAGPTCFRTCSRIAILSSCSGPSEPLGRPPYLPFSRFQLEKVSSIPQTRSSRHYV